ncbi:hypothetical protein N7540_010996 [Penicillium herquei]|nr:hypothetical protein N7540_010996 [Penicillium herquei]
MGVNESKIISDRISSARRKAKKVNKNDIIPFLHNDPLVCFLCPKVAYHYLRCQVVNWASDLWASFPADAKSKIVEQATSSRPEKARPEIDQFPPTCVSKWTSQPALFFKPTFGNANAQSMFKFLSTGSKPDSLDGTRKRLIKVVIYHLKERGVKADEIILMVTQGEPEEDRKAAGKQLSKFVSQGGRIDLLCREIFGRQGTFPSYYSVLLSLLPAIPDRSIDRVPKKSRGSTKLEQITELYGQAERERVHALHALAQGKPYKNLAISLFSYIWSSYETLFPVLGISLPGEGLYIQELEQEEEEEEETFSSADEQTLHDSESEAPLADDFEETVGSDSEEAPVNGPRTGYHSQPDQEAEMRPAYGSIQVDYNFMSRPPPSPPFHTSHIGAGIGGNTPMPYTAPGNDSIEVDYNFISRPPPPPPFTTSGARVNIGVGGNTSMPYTSSGNDFIEVDYNFMSRPPPLPPFHTSHIGACMGGYTPMPHTDPAYDSIEVGYNFMSRPPPAFDTSHAAHDASGDIPMYQ